MLGLHHLAGRPMCICYLLVSFALQNSSFHTSNTLRSNKIGVKDAETPEKIVKSKLPEGAHKIVPIGDPRGCCDFLLRKYFCPLNKEILIVFFSEHQKNTIHLKI